jgi:hypothetical protein
VLKSSGCATAEPKLTQISQLTCALPSTWRSAICREIQAHWGTELALERLAECRSMLRTVLEAS